MATEREQKGMKAITIRDVRTFAIQMGGAGGRFVVVKVLTSEPELYGLGCATFTQRYHAVQAAIEKHLKPFALGRDVARGEEFFSMAMTNGYWRNGPVLNNAIAGIDQALWDIRGKQAGMPVYQLLGGKCREAAAVYVHADGRDAAEVVENARRYMQEGYRYVRVQMGGYGGRAAGLVKPDGAPDGTYFDPRQYARNALRMIERVRAELGEEVELIHDVHERLSPIEAVQFAKDVERFRLYYLEDPLAPEDSEWFRWIRRQSATPLAMPRPMRTPAAPPSRLIVNDSMMNWLRMSVRRAPMARRFARTRCCSSRRAGADRRLGVCH
jgi:mannonate dehydratase